MMAHAEANWVIREFAFSLIHRDRSLRKALWQIEVSGDLRAPIGQTIVFAFGDHPLPKSLVPL